MVANAKKMAICCAVCNIFLHLDIRRTSWCSKDSRHLSLHPFWLGGWVLQGVNFIWLIYSVSYWGNLVKWLKEPDKIDTLYWLCNILLLSTKDALLHGTGFVSKKIGVHIFITDWWCTYSREDYGCRECLVTTAALNLKGAKLWL